MRYAMLIYSSETVEEEESPEEAEVVMNEYNAFTREVHERGVYQSGEALMPTTSATSVRVRNGETLTTDGPFAETKEQLGGFYILNCENLDEAIEFAAKVPGAKWGTVEVRPIMEFE